MTPFICGVQNVDLKQRAETRLPEVEEKQDEGRDWRELVNWCTVAC